MVEPIVYKLGEKRRPANDKIRRFFMLLNGIPLLRKLPFVQQQLFHLFSLPKSTTINNGFYCSAPTLKIGQNVGLADTFIVAYAPVTIGDNCSFSFKNMIITSSHDFEDFSTVIAKPVTIGDNVWVTSNVLILPGVTIGNNSVIGAGSVVTRDIPSGVFAAGNPCKVIKSINFKNDKNDKAPL